MECSFCTRAIGVELRNGRPPRRVPGWLVLHGRSRRPMAPHPSKPSAKLLHRPYRALCPRCLARLVSS